MKYDSLFKLTICVLLSLSLPHGLAQTVPRPFSADYTLTEKGFVGKGRIYVSWPHVRMDSPGAFIVTNYETGTSYLFEQEKHVYFETRAPEYIFDSQNPCSKQPNLTCKRVGKDTVNGRKCDQWQTTDKAGNTGSICIDEVLIFPIRGQKPNGPMMEYSNIKEGPQAASMFEVPADYEKIPSPFRP